MALSGGAALAAPPSATVDWSEGVIRAIGSGPPDLKAVNPAQARLAADRAARADAVNGLIEAAKALRIRGERTVRDAASDATRRAVLQAAVEKSLKVTARRTFSDHGVEIDVALPLGAIEAALSTDVPPPPAEKERGKSRHSGLIVDARALSFAPHLSPRLVAEGGEILYSTAQLDEERRRTVGAAAWVKSPDAARRHARAGRKPLTVKPLRVDGGDLVLAKADAAKIAELVEGQVVIVTR